MSGCICHNNCHFNTSCKNLQTQVNELKEGCKNELNQGLVNHKFCFFFFKILRDQNASKAKCSIWRAVRGSHANDFYFCLLQVMG